MDIQAYRKAKIKGISSRDRKTLTIKCNGRSTDFIIPSFQIGCEASCSYCYVNRHRSYGNNIETYTNHEEIQKAVLRHYLKLGEKISNQTHPFLWTYDIGESTDCMSPLTIETANKYISFFQEHMPKAMCSFATKFPSFHKKLIPVKRDSARIRVSLTTPYLQSLVEVGTNNIETRLKSIQGIRNKGYEVHINLSPVIVYEGWLDDYRQLLLEMKENLSKEVMNQIKYEVIFLTYHPKSHEMNMRWNQEGEQVLWNPTIQEEKKRDGTLRYKWQQKNYLTADFRSVLHEITPSNPIRYIF